MSFLEIKDIRKKIGNVEILKGINIDLEKGGFLVLVGPSGCGKSTLLNAIAGLLPPSSGDIVIDGQVVTDLHPSKRDIAMVFQSYALYPNMTVEENIAFALEMRGVDKAAREAAVKQVAKTLQIEHLLKRRPSQLSGGQRQRVAMGRALVRQPRVFLFDEPLSNLDAKLRVEVRAEIKALHQNTHATIVYVTHDQIEAMTLASKIVVLKEGTVQQVGAPSEIYNRPANLFVADFMGSPAMNMLKGNVVSSDGAQAIALFGNENVKVAMPPSVTKSLADGKEIILGLRPEAITDTGLLDPQVRSVAQIEADVTMVEPTGSDTFVTGRLDGASFTARTRADVHVSVGQKFPFAFNLDKAVVFDPETTGRID
ncbi:ABC transporter ATP-binding protein [Neorhizobium sp. Rsf11]|uniref:ABC transporter ATP-binding protein n=2 Tax=Neorhizobium TaxID=1525371 RepID=A0ABV0M5R7_9HYPH|nr:ABC transporter ATP-binding protein [Neorhizobium petrolearium]MCC2611682.1 ABC transporter ATP-binding protein [Neorhizobium petrolearium]WGI66861.1 ABC transporter ATP-binding protein [Neorhizobium petrolearium]